MNKESRLKISASNVDKILKTVRIKTEVKKCQDTNTPAAIAIS
jgi:hypothetical protein